MIDAVVVQETETQIVEVVALGPQGPEGPTDWNKLTNKPTAYKADIANSTAKGVPYLDANQVLRSTSGFVFDGTSLGIGTSTPTAQGLSIIRGGTGDAGIHLGSATASTFLQQSANGHFYAYNYGAYSLIFGTNATERMRVTSVGNVGIGTSAPGSKLEVSAGANSSGALKVSATGTAVGNFASMNFETGTAAWTVGTEASNGRFFIYNNAAAQDQLRLSGGTNAGVGLYAKGTGVISLYTAGSIERMRIDASGNLALGTSLASARLQVQGNTTSDVAFFQQSGTNSAIVTVNQSDAPGTNAAARPVVSLRKGGTTMFNLSCDGGSSTQGLTYFESFGTASGQIFITNGSERMRLDASGNLGLGTSTPGVRLDVQGGAGVEAQVLSSGSVARVRVKDSAGNASISTTSGALLLETGSSERARFDNAGALLIGQTVKTSSERVLISYSSAGAVPRTLQLHNPNTTAGTGSLLAFSGLTNSGAQSDLVQLIGLAENATGNGALAFRIAGAAGVAAEAMRLNSSGFLGLGTDAPGYRLDVDHGAGVARFRNGTTGYGSIALGASATAANNCQLASDGSGNFIIYKGVPGSGTEQLRLTSQGILGVGASAPTNYTGSGYGSIAVNGTTGGILEFQGAGTQAARITGWSNTLAIHTNNVERVRVDSSGNTLIGRSAQSSGGKLEVAGNIVANLPSTAPTLGTNSDMSFQLVSNTQLKILVRGSDGVTRSNTLTLA